MNFLSKTIHLGTIIFTSVFLAVLNFLGNEIGYALGSLQLCLALIIIPLVDEYFQGES